MGLASPIEISRDLLECDILDKVWGGAQFWYLGNKSLFSYGVKDLAPMTMGGKWGWKKSWTV